MKKQVIPNNDYTNLVTIYGATYSNAIKKYLKAYKTLSYDNIVAFLNDAKKKYSSSTVALYKAALKKYIKSSIFDLQKRAMIDIAFDDIKIASQRTMINDEHIISIDTVRSMIAKANIRDSLMIEMLFITGMRVSELINIELKNCRLVNNNDYQYINILIIGKGSKERFINISKGLFERIQKTFGNNIYLFETNNKTKYSRVFIYRIVNRAGYRVLGTKQVHPHTLRHSFATHLLINEKKSIKAVSTYLGHSSTAITSDYYIHDTLNINDFFLVAHLIAK